MGSASKVKIYGAGGNMIFGQKTRGNGGYFQFDAPVNFNGGLKGMFAPLGRFLFVLKATGNDGNDGLSWATAYKTIGAALAHANKYDTIVIGFGVYDAETLPLNITADGQKILGVMTSGHQWGQPSIKALSTLSIMTTNSPNIGPEIAFLSIYTAGAACGIEVGTTANTWRTHIHDVHFAGYGSGLWGVIMGNTTASGRGHSATIDAPSTIVEDCYFDQWKAGSIHFNCGGGSVVRRCVIVVETALSGINYYTDSTSRPFASILDNKFITLDSTNAVGITVDNTPTAGYLLIDGNHFANFAADDNHAVSKRAGYMGLNYRGVTVVAVS